MLYHGLQHGSCTAHVVFIVFQGLYHTLAHLGISGEMYHCVYLFGVKYGIYEGLVPYIALMEPRLWVYRLYKSRFKVIRHSYVVSAVYEFVHGMAADVAGAAQNQYGFHGNSPYRCRGFIARHIFHIIN